MNNEFTEFYECECYSHVLAVRKFHDEPQVYLDKYQHPDIELTFIQRVKLSICYIFKPEKFDIRGDVILSKDNARKLGEDLMKLTSEKPNNMEFGKTGRLKVGDILKVTSVEKGKPSICDEIENFCPDCNGQAYWIDSNAKNGEQKKYNCKTCKGKGIL